MDHNETDSEYLMDSINALFAPPTAESENIKGFLSISKINKSKRHLDEENFEYMNAVPASNKFVDDPGWKKPKANSHDYCDSCGCTEGERLVCDRCPTSFHLECLDPPMDSDEATTGIWYCPSCTTIMREDDNSSNCSDNNPDNLIVSKDFNSLSSRLSVQMSKLFTESRVLRSEYSEINIDESNRLIAFWEIIHQSKFLNPKEFDLPKDLVPGIKFPGSYKTPNERKKKRIIELECGQIPRPVQRCYVCAKTCLLAPLLCCDFCDSSFHLNCLDPPLTHYPPRLDRWMCPNHAEHTVDNNFVKTIRLSERMKQWDRLKNINVIPNLDRDLLSMGDTYSFSSFSKHEEMEIIRQFLYRINQDRLANLSEKQRLEEMKILGDGKSNVEMMNPPKKVNDPTRIVVPVAVKNLYKNRVKSVKNHVNGSCNYAAEREVVKILASLLDDKRTDDTEEANTDKENLDRITKLIPHEIHQLNNVKSRAILIPLDDTEGPTFHMQYKQLKIGSSSDSCLRFDLCKLKNSVKCTKVSNFHAKIFFDEQTRLFELINYSENGSLVDNILYGFNKHDYYTLDSNDLSKRAREIIDGSVRDCPDENQAFPLFTPKKRIKNHNDISEHHECYCEEENLEKSNSESGWEGSAILHHGSHLKFGCFQFVFSIISN